MPPPTNVWILAHPGPPWENISLLGNIQTLGSQYAARHKPSLIGGTQAWGSRILTGEAGARTSSCSGLWCHGQHSRGEVVLQEKGEDVLLGHWSPCQLTLSWAKGGLCSMGLS